MALENFPAMIATALLHLGGSRLLAAVSGGADSVAMLRGLHELQQEQGYEFIAAHLNHGLRGQDSDADADWVQELCEELGIACVVEKADVAEDAARSGKTLEEAARDLRYDFFKRTARSHGCQFVAVAHTADDQVETVLHHIVRGTGLAGLQGMPSRRRLAESDDGTPIELIRPLLQVTRGEVEEYLRELRQSYRDDDSNTDDRFTRNRIRHILLPLLREQFNPQADAAVLRLSQQAADVQLALDDVADEILCGAIREESSAVCRLDCMALRQHCPAVIRAALVRLWQRIGWPRQKMGFREWDRLAQLVQSGESATSAVTLPGRIDARRRRDLLVLMNATSAE